MIKSNKERNQIDKSLKLQSQSRVQSDLIKSVAVALGLTTIAGITYSAMGPLLNHLKNQPPEINSSQTLDHTLNRDIASSSSRPKTILTANSTHYSPVNEITQTNYEPNQN